MGTVFIAVQCFQCSTMQVKQRKKSSNKWKWNCAVCNEKQSVRKVFSQGFIAKDVRNFVQTFNMSRSHHHHEEEEEEEEEEETLAQNPYQPRTDWSEYLDHPDDQREPNVVTDLPQPFFRNGYPAAGEQLRQRNVKKKKEVENSGKEPGAIMKGNFTRVGGNQHNHSNSCDDDDREFTDAGSSSVMVKLKRPVSKWNNFIHDDDDDERQFESTCQEINHAAFETKVNDEIVEDDVHPDFM